MLSWLSLVWMGAEGTIAIVAGVMAGSLAPIRGTVASAWRRVYGRTRVKAQSKETHGSR